MTAAKSGAMRRTAQVQRHESRVTFQHRDQHHARGCADTDTCANTSPQRKTVLHVRRDSNQLRETRKMISARREKLRDTGWHSMQSEAWATQVPAWSGRGGRKTVETAWRSNWQKRVATGIKGSD
eukprot:6174683-Pleurochrysis_carterae.AAC.3